MWRTSSARRKLLPSTRRLPGPRLMVVRPLSGIAGFAMDAFTKLFGNLLAFVYHCFARNHHTPIEWAEKGVRKEDHVRPWLRRMANKNAYGVYLIFKSMEQGPSFRI